MNKVKFDYIVDTFVELPAHVQKKVKVELAAALGVSPKLSFERLLALDIKRHPENWVDA